MDKEIPEGKIDFHACRTAPYEQNKLVEAGGIEPPSRCISVEASTCVVRRLVLGLEGSGGQDPSRPNPNLFFPDNASDERYQVACCFRPSKSRRQDPASVTAIYAANAN